ncbi:hypothetical protein BKA70DRAFT_1187691 [Coprinopsis sp. MPI-PUGE-AT-0042]|nr:hypothetical protein BKA70DRAFT_1187691 [Coprinopsis sp. MPI-PUGE-AT-0042]
MSSSSGLFASIVSGLTFLSSRLVHPVYFPYPWAPVVHAARISLVFQTLSRRNNANWKKVLWGPYIGGYLIACWGGGVLTHLIMGLPPPHFYSFHPWINYITVHLVLTALFNVFPNVLEPKIYDTLLFPVDGLLRAHSVVSALALYNVPSISNPLSALSAPSPYKSMDSVFGHIVLGILASAAGGISLSSLSLWSEEWKFGTPPILKANLWGSADVWGGALAAVVYGSATHSPAFTIPAQLTAAYYPLTLIPRPLLDLFFKPGADSLVGSGAPPVLHFTVPGVHSLLGLASTKTMVIEAPAVQLNIALDPLITDVAVPVGPMEAKAMAALTLVAVFGARVLMTHWRAPAVKATNVVTKEGKRK